MGGTICTDKSTHNINSMYTIVGKNIYYDKSILDDSDAIFNKFFYINYKNLYVFQIKCIEKLFVYLYDIKNNSKTLIDVFDTNIKNLEPYVQISYEHNLLSIPDGDYLYVYDILSSINSMSLVEHVPKTHILIGNNPSKNISDTFTESVTNIILYKNKIILYYENKIIICGYDTSQKIISFNTNIKLSENLNHILEYTDDLIKIYKSENYPNYKQIQIKKSYDSHTLNISDDGELMVFVSDNQLNIICMVSKKEIVLPDILKLDSAIISDLTIINYTYMLQTNMFFEKIYAVKYNLSENQFILWLIICTKTNYEIIGPQYIAMGDNTSKNIHRGIHTYMYQSDKCLILYNMYKFIYQYILDSLLDICVKQLHNKQIEINIINRKIVVEEWISEYMIKSNITNFDFIHIIMRWVSVHRNIEIFVSEFLTQNIIDNNIYQICDTMIQIHQNILDNMIAKQYIEYLIIKLIVCFNSNKKILDIGRISDIYKSFVATRPFLLRILIDIFGYRIDDMVSKKN